MSTKAHHEVERTRLDLMRTFQGTPHPAWPRHIVWYHEMWQSCLASNPMDPIKLGIFTADELAKWQQEMEQADKAGGGHH